MISFWFFKVVLLCIFLITDLGLWVLILRKDQGGLHVYFILVSSLSFEW